jgi:hypothetical protein
MGRTPEAFGMFILSFDSFFRQTGKGTFEDERRYFPNELSEIEVCFNDFAFRIENFLYLV